MSKIMILKNAKFILNILVILFIMLCGSRSVLAASCDAYFSFDGNLNDSGTNAYNGQLIAKGGDPANGSAQYIPGKKGQALKLDGKTFVRAPIDLSPDNCPQLTLTGWMQLQKDNKKTHTLISNATTSAGVTLSQTRNRINMRGGRHQFTTPDLIRQKEWIFFAASWDFSSKKMSLQIKNRIQQADINTSNMVMPEPYMWIGAYNDALQWPTEGILIDELHVFSRVLSKNEVSELARGGNVAANSGTPNQNGNQPGQSPTNTPPDPCFNIACSGSQVCFSGSCLDGNTTLAEAQDKVCSGINCGGGFANNAATNNAMGNLGIPANPVKELNQLGAEADKKVAQQRKRKAKERDEIERKRRCEEIIESISLEDWLNQNQISEQILIPKECYIEFDKALSEFQVDSNKKQAEKNRIKTLKVNNSLVRFSEISGSSGNLKKTLELPINSLAYNIVLKEDDGYTCAIKIDGDNIISRNITSKHTDECHKENQSIAEGISENITIGSNTFSAEIPQFPVTNRVDKPMRVLVGIKVCADRKNNAIKNLNMKTKLLNEDGRLTEAKENLVIEDQGCKANDWGKMVICPANMVASGLDAHFNTTTGLLTNTGLKSLVGIELRCKSVTLE